MSFASTRRFACLALLAALCAGCSPLADALPAGGPISQYEAETYARLSSGVSLASVEIVSARLSTYGAERPGARNRTPDAQVWAVVLSGAFPYGSCKIALPVFGSSAKPGPPASPCPTPTLRERVLLDALNGRMIEVIPGG